MRPRHTAAENSGAGDLLGLQFDGFNEAAAYSRGKLLLTANTGVNKNVLQ